MTPATVGALLAGILGLGGAAGGGAAAFSGTRSIEAAVAELRGDVRRTGDQVSELRAGMSELRAALAGAWQRTEQQGYSRDVAERLRDMETRLRSVEASTRTLEARAAASPR
jgi:phage shock protein A